MAMRLSGLMSGMDTESIIQQLVEAKKTKVTKAVKAQKTLKYKQDAWKSLNTKIKTLHMKSLSNMRWEGSFIKKTTTVSNSSVVSVITGEGAMNGVQTLKVNNLAKPGYLTGSKMELTDEALEGGAKLTGDTKLSELGYTGGLGTINVETADGLTPIKLNGDVTIDSLVGALKQAGLNANFDEDNGRIFITSKASGAANDFEITAADTDGAKLLDALGLNYDSVKSYEHSKGLFEKELAELQEQYESASDADKADLAQKILETQVKIQNVEDMIKKAPQKTDAMDAKIELNGVEYTSNTNSFKINGITLTVSATTAPGEEVSITTKDDTDGIYDMIKGFLKEYNEVINEMDKLYNADSAKGYDPLTDEEKEAMSDSAIEEWEDKIKESILRKDSTISLVSGEMKKIMMEGVEVNGKKMYLSDFGIGTLNYFLSAENEKNAYHIDGDPDDLETSANADKLKTMIANDPDTVVSFFTGLAKNLYGKMSELMETNNDSSAFTVYDDKKMQREYDDYTTKIKELEKKLADYEDKWYAKFAAMETALAKMQNNASAVTSLLGGS